RSIQGGLERDASTFKIALQENENLFDGVIDLDVGKPELRVADQGPEARDDIARLASLFDDARRRLAGFIGLGRVPREPPEARFRARNDSSQRLIDLVNN